MWYRKQEIIKMDKQIERAGDDNKNKAAARLGISLGEMMDEIHIIPASYDVRDTVGYGGTCVYMKSGKKLAELIELLRTGDAIRKKKMTVYGVTNCGMESERVYRGLDELTEAKGYLTIVIVKYSRKV